MWLSCNRRVVWLCSAAVHWLFTGLLIAASAGVVAFTGHLLRRLFTTEPRCTTEPSEPGSAALTDTGAETGR